ncbi:BnaC09g39530D [Brassica napus]|uniref:BnaC09g39530D protein n=1 Tax=Brassica napus TaxID=3708 RepID=A0A078GLD9_BRANA|nr:BnaC09g39530D [Brassica napus]
MSRWFDPYWTVRPFCLPLNLQDTRIDNCFSSPWSSTDNVFIIHEINIDS